VPAAAHQNETHPEHRPGGLLRQRNFGLLWTGETISQAGSSMAVVGVPLLAVAVLHASTFAISALTAAAYLPWLAIGLPAGAWVDRRSPRPLTSFRQTYTPPQMLGRITASQRFLVFGTIPLGALLAGGLGTALGVRDALWAMLAMYALSGTLLLTRAFRADKNLPVTTATLAQARS
jgi:hypothetical protein